MGEKHKPGEIAKRSGQYPIQGPRGGDTGKERTIVKGELRWSAVLLLA